MTSVAAPIPASAIRSTAPVEIALVAALALAAHWPVQGLLGPDDSFFMTVARMWSDGAPPYLNAFDVKPPGFFALLAVAQSLFGVSAQTLNGLTALCDLVTALCLWRIGRNIGAPAAGLFAAIGFPWASQMLAENAPYPPLATATVAAFLFASGSLPRREVWAGLALGFAVTIKQTAALEGLAAFWWLLREAPASRGRVAAGFLAGAAAAPLAFVVYFAAVGGLAPMFADVVTSALLRPGADGGTLAHVESLLRNIWPVAGAAALAAARWRALPGRAASSEALALWFAASLVDLVLQHARWTNYLNPVFAPALLLAGLGISALFHDRLVRSAALALALLATAVSAYPLRAWRFMAPVDDAALDAAAEALKVEAPAPGDRLLAILDGAMLNARLGLQPPTPYFHYLHLLCDFPGAGPARLAEALAARPRFVVIPNHRISPYCADPAAWPLFAQGLAGYRRLAPVPGLDLYERTATR